MDGMKVQWSHGTLYGAVGRLKEGHFIRTVHREKRRPGHSVEPYQLTLLGFFRALKSCALTGRKVNMAKVAAKYEKLLPEILRQWRIFEENGVAGLAESRLLAVAMDISTEVGLRTAMEYYGRRHIPTISKRMVEEEKRITKVRVMRIFLFGPIDDDPFPTNLEVLDWTSSLQKSLELRMWALRIARIYVNRHTMATARWKNVLSELEALKPTSK